MVAEAMTHFLRQVLSETNAAGVILDLSNLDYSAGDAIRGVPMPLIEHRHHLSAASIVAAGRTARALEPLFEPTPLRGLAGVKLFPTRQAALAYVEQRLEPEPTKQNESTAATAGSERQRESTYFRWLILTGLLSGLAGWVVQGLLSGGFVYWALPLMWIAAIVFTANGDNLVESIVLLVIVGVMAFFVGRSPIADKIGVGTVPGTYVALAISKITFALAQRGIFEIET